MASENLVNQSGPLPISKTVTPNITGSATLVAAGSVWSSTADRMIGFEIVLDGDVIGKAQIFSNGPTTHRAVVSEHIAVQLDKQWGITDPSQPPQPASYALELRVMNSDSIGDLNDHYSVTLVA